MLFETKNLTKDFTRGGRSFRAVDNINFYMDSGEFIHIIGRSGSGKTTFLNLLAGILDPSLGSVYINSENLADMDDNKKSKYRNSFIGFVPQALGAMVNLSVLDNVRLPHFLFKNEGNGIERASALLDMMGILNLKDEFPRQLSGGELKRVLLARALMNSPKIIIADEPTADLDKQTTIEIMELLKKINQNGTSLIIVTHELDILKYGNRILTMSNGQLDDGVNKTDFGKDIVQ